MVSFAKDEVLVENHAAFTIHFDVNERYGILQVLCLLVNKNRWTLPGGKCSGVETPRETAQRELLQEVAEHFQKQESMTVYYDPEPVRVVESARDEGGIHKKYFFLANQLDCELRTKDIPDGADILGPPQYISLKTLIHKFEEQGKKSDAQLAGLIAALERVCKKETPLAEIISMRYANVLIGYSHLLEVHK